jgi:phosphonopyruvate decarboxylase
MHAFGKYATIATTGYAYRELHATVDRPNYFYMAGSMGHAAAIGLGVSINTTEPTVVLDGDGALLMKMGTCATIGRFSPKNLMHIVIDNGLFESTGGQSSNAGSVDFSQIAQACSYRQVWQCTGRDAIERFSQTIDPLSGPTFAHIRVLPSRGPAISRPKLDLQQVATRFREFVISKTTPR